MYRTDNLLATASAVPVGTAAATLAAPNFIEQWLRIIALAVSIVASIYMIRLSRKRQRNHDEQRAFYTRKAQAWAEQELADFNSHGRRQVALANVAIVPTDPPIVVPIDLTQPKP